MSIKTTSNLAKRIIKKIQAGEINEQMLTHMLDSLVANRDRQIRDLERRTAPKTFKLEREAIVGGLKSCIQAHGPITSSFIESAAKRIYGTCLRSISDGTTVPTQENLVE